METHDHHGKDAILVVDDEAMLREHAAGLLEDNGFDVATAANAEAALKLLESRCDLRLLFTDVQMPGRFNGIELARKVHERWPHISLMITSGQKRPSGIPDDGRFIAKPYRAEDLIAEVEDLLQKRG